MGLHFRNSNTATFLLRIPSYEADDCSDENHNRSMQVCDQVAKFALSAPVKRSREARSHVGDTLSAGSICADSRILNRDAS
ncbi:hypothetical protein PILCRDRAFT_813153 [Piloderma croceum F 1598]|uniref:Uncharacterized protein n=1 Tax=Piloderma croceum (strain F 1598) TaxID=765440 RepID=A0A0C3GEZ9_PILCF|nr:hypothetical protein PILCRDRAFT_813153 [Piloderma croceum F 1598]